MNLFQHLLPDGRAFRITVTKPLRKIFEALRSALKLPILSAFDTVYMSLLPRATTLLDRWYETMGMMYPSQLTGRAELEAEWEGGADTTLASIQDALQVKGFPVYLHESRAVIFGSTVLLNPLDYLWPSTIPPRTPMPGYGYPLVNKLYDLSSKIFACCGEPEIQCGEFKAASGYFLYSSRSPKLYTVPASTGSHIYFIYVGAETMGELVDIPLARREELEDLCLKLCPTHHWLGMLVNYV